MGTFVARSSSRVRAAPVAGCAARNALIACAVLLAANARLGVAQFETVQEAIEAAQDGDTVLIPPGEFRERIRIVDKSIFLRAAVPAPQNPNRLVPGGHPFDHQIVPPDDGLEESAVIIAGGPGTRVVLEGFRITGGRAPRGGGIAVRGEVLAAVTRCILFKNEAFEEGGGIFVEPRAGLSLFATAFLVNFAEGRGSALSVLAEPQAPTSLFSMVNCTAAANVSPGPAVSLDGVPDTACVYNNIIAGNEGGGPDIANTGAFVLAQWSWFGQLGPGIEPGQGTVEDPDFVTDRQLPRAREGNPRLPPGSQAIDAAFGNPPCFEGPLGPFKQAGSDFEGDEAFDDPETADTGSGDPPYKDVGADEYMPIFIRADANADGEIDIGDPVSVLDYLFGDGSSTCFDSIDSNDSGEVDVSDPIYTLNYLFAAGPLPPDPFPFMGTDPTADALTCTYYGSYP